MDALLTVPRIHSSIHDVIAYAFSLLTEAKVAQERREALESENHTSPPLPYVNEEEKEEEVEEAKRRENSHNDDEKKEDPGEGGEEGGEKSNIWPQKDGKCEDDDGRGNDEGDSMHTQKVTPSERHETTGKSAKELETCENGNVEKVETMMTEKLMDKASDPEKRREECEGKETSESRGAAECWEKTQQKPTTTEGADNTSTYQEIERAKFLLTQEIENGLNSNHTVKYRE